MKSNFLRYAFTLVFVAKALFSFAEEGMLIPSLIAAFESDMKAKGMKLSASDIYSVNSTSMKDAILQFGGGCTAELVSNQGLLLTNHHCGYGQIQSHSSLEHDYLKNGFWAKNKSDELANPGLTAMRIVRIDDVTKDVLMGASSKSDQAVIMANIKKLCAAAIVGTHYEAEIKAFNYGNDYYLMLKEVFLDVRFVGHLQTPLENLVEIQITGFGHVILEISLCFAFMPEKTINQRHILQIMFLTLHYITYRFPFKTVKKATLRWCMDSQVRQSSMLFLPI
jgi:hypothetical protein